TARSSLPSPLKSPTASARGFVAVARVAGGPKVPSPLPRRPAEAPWRIAEDVVADGQAAVAVPVTVPGCGCDRARGAGCGRGRHVEVAVAVEVPHHECGGCLGRRGRGRWTEGAVAIAQQHAHAAGADPVGGRQVELAVPAEVPDHHRLRTWAGREGGLRAERP